MNNLEFKTSLLKRRKRLKEDVLVYPVGSQEFPSWQAVKSNYIDFDIDVQVTELNNYPNPPGLNPGLFPEFKTYWGRNRKLLASIELAEYPSTPPPDPKTGQDFPSWAEPTKYTIYFELGRVPLPEPIQTATPESASGIAWDPLRSFKVKQKRKHLVVQELNVYPVTTPPSEPGSPLAREFQTRQSSHRKLRTVELSVYPVSPARTDQGFPSWDARKAFKVTRNIKQLDKSSIGQPPEALSDKFPSWKLQLSFKIDQKRKHLVVQEVNVYPETPFPGTPEGWPSWALQKSNKIAFSFEVQTTDFNRFPETPPPPVLTWEEQCRDDLIWTSLAAGSGNWSELSKDDSEWTKQNPVDIPTEPCN